VDIKTSYRHNNLTPQLSGNGYISVRCETTLINE